MRILLVNKFWKPVGGVEEHVFTVKRCLESMGHEVVPFAMADEGNLPSPYQRFFPSAVEFRTGPLRRRADATMRATFGIETIRQIRRLLDEVPIDAAYVVHTYHQLGTTFLRVLSSRRIPVVLSLHDYKVGCPSYRLFSDATGQMCTICLDHPSGFLWGPTVSRCWDGSRAAGMMLTAEAVVTRLAQSYSKGAGAVVVLNDLQHRCALRAGIDERRIHRIPHFVEVSDAPPGQREPHVLFVGRLVVEKGVDQAIRACAQAGAPLRILGDGRLRPDLEALAASLDADVSFAGQVSTEEVTQAMTRASALLVPSIWHEVSALVIGQAMGAHLPVIATATGGSVDLLREGRGLLYAPGDVDHLAGLVRAVLDDPALAASLAGKAAAFSRSELTRSRWLQGLKDAFASTGVNL